MTWRRPLVTVVTVAMLCVAGGGPLAAQTPPAKNPFEGNPDAIKYGMGLFRSRCADCHGMDARGVRGPDITQVWASGRTDDGLFKTIQEGVPNTEMPANPRMNDRETWQLLAYLRTLATPAPTDSARGNAQNGERIFRANCAGCHRVNGVGGRLGPDLSRVGSARARDAIVFQIRRGREEQPLERFVGKRRQTLGDEVVEILWDRERLSGRQPTPSQQRASELEPEKRIAARGFVDAAQRRPRQRLSEPDTDELVQSSEGHRPDLDLPPPLLGQRAVQPKHRTVAPVRPTGKKEGDRPSVEAARGELEHRRRRGVEPLDVVDCHK